MHDTVRVLLVLLVLLLLLFCVHARMYVCCHTRGDTLIVDGLIDWVTVHSAVGTILNHTVEIIVESIIMTKAII